MGTEHAPSSLIDSRRSTAARSGGTARRRFLRRPRSRHSALHRAENWGALKLTGPYVLLLLVAGIIPSGYAIIQSVSKHRGDGYTLLENYQTVMGDFRFTDTFLNIGKLLVWWLPLMMIGTIALALLVHESRGRFATSMRFIFYLPGALAGMANFMLWLFILDPTVSPVAFLLEGFGYETLNEVVQPGRIPIIIAAMLFFQGAGTWLVIVIGGLNGIPDEVVESARVDGATSWQMAWNIKLPIIRPWIAYMALMNIAYGFQLFLEPQVLSQATKGVVSPQWAPNQLGFTYAYGILNTPAAAAMSVLLLMLTLGLGVIIVTKTGMFAEAKE